MNDLIYLDYNGTTPIDKEVIEVISQELKNSWGNPSSGNDLETEVPLRSYRGLNYFIVGYALKSCDKTIFMDKRQNEPSIKLDCKLLNQLD